MRKFDKFLKHMNENIGRITTVKDSDGVGLSRNYFQKLLTEAHKSNPAEYMGLVDGERVYRFKHQITFKDIEPVLLQGRKTKPGEGAPLFDPESEERMAGHRIAGPTIPEDLAQTLGTEIIKWLEERFTLVPKNI